MNLPRTTQKGMSPSNDRNRCLVIRNGSRVSRAQGVHLSVAIEIMETCLMPSFSVTYTASTAVTSGRYWIGAFAPFILAYRDATTSNRPTWRSLRGGPYGFESGAAVPDFTLGAHETLSRGWASSSPPALEPINGLPHSTLVVAPVREHIDPRSLRRKSRIFAADRTGSGWAARLGTFSVPGTSALVLEDPGGGPLGRLVGRPMELGHSFVSPSGCRARSPGFTSTGSSTRTSSLPTRW